MNLNLLDSSQGNVLSKQPLRIAYIRQPGATGGVNAFDTVFTSSAFIHDDALYALRGANIEGPNVDPGKKLQTFYGAFFDQPNAAVNPAGTVTNYYGAYFRTLMGAPGTITNGFALVTEPGAGNVGIGTITPSSQLEVAGDVKASGNGTFTGSVTAASFTGNGANLTNLNAVTSLNGQTNAVTLAGTNGLGVSQGAGVVTVASNATPSNTASTIVSRDGSGNFSVGTLALSGNLTLPNTTASAGAIIVGNRLRQGRARRQHDGHFQRRLRPVRAFFQHDGHGQHRLRRRHPLLQHHGQQQHRLWL